MSILSISVLYEVDCCFAIFNLAACVVLVILRIYHQSNQKIQHPKLSLTGLLCIVLALLCCSALLNLKSNWYFGDIGWCALSMKLSSTIYAMHRVILYIFIILRVEVVNHANLMSPRLLCAGKVLIGVNGICMIGVHIVFVTGVTDEHSSCSFDVTQDGILVPVWVIDTFICAGGTWMFIHPLKKILENIENRSLHNMLRKTKIWSIVCLVSTLISNLIAGFIDGAAGVVGFDCSITSLGLLMMMLSKSHKMPKSFIDSSKAGRVELQDKIILPEGKPSSGPQRRLSSVLLDKIIQGVLREDPSENNFVTL